MIVAGTAQRVLVVGAETLTRIADPTDRSAAVLFGDGAGAVVLGATGTTGATIGPFDLGADGTLAPILGIHAGGSRRPSTTETVAAREHFIHMNGQEVYRHAVTRMVASSRRVLADAQVDADEVDLLVGHQANGRILDAVATRLGIPADRCVVTVDRHGNTSSASIPLALADARERGALRPGALVLLTAFGAGLTWGSCLVRWGRS